MHNFHQTTELCNRLWTGSARASAYSRRAGLKNPRRTLHWSIVVPLLLCLVGLTNCAGGGGSSQQEVSNTGSEGTIGTPNVAPNSVTAGIPQVVTITSQISDSSLTAGSVNLQRLDHRRNVIVLGTMHDDGLNGDAVAGDHIYTVQTTFFEDTPDSIMLRVAAAFKGQLIQGYSRLAYLNASSAESVG